MITIYQGNKESIWSIEGVGGTNLVSEVQLDMVTIATVSDDEIDWIRSKNKAYTNTIYYGDRAKYVALLVLKEVIKNTT